MSLYVICHQNLSFSSSSPSLRFHPLTLHRPSKLLMMLPEYAPQECEYPSSPEIQDVQYGPCLHSTTSSPIRPIPPGPRHISSCASLEPPSWLWPGGKKKKGTKNSIPKHHLIRAPSCHQRWTLRAPHLTQHILLVQCWWWYIATRQTATCSM